MRDNRRFVRGYFEHVYRQEDPYDIAQNPEELKKRSETMATIAGVRFGNALEIGGGEGLLAECLADQVDKLHMVDLSERALQRAQERLHDKSNVEIGRLDIVGEPLPGVFDLIVCSEVLVYVQLTELDDVRDKIVAALPSGGHLLLVHSRSIHDDDAGLEYKDFGAKTVHGAFLDDPLMSARADETYDMYRITLLQKEAAGAP